MRANGFESERSVGAAMLVAHHVGGDGVSSMTARQDHREARAYLIIGVLLSDMCGPESAAQLYHQALARDPELVAAHVRLGISRAYTEDYAEMVADFSTAIRLDPAAASVAAGKPPEELEQISRILFPHEQELTTGSYTSAMPAEFVLAADLAVLARGYLAEGHAGVAVEALERALKIDPTFSLAIALISFGYLLLRRSNKDVMRREMGSVLWEIEPELASLLFKKAPRKN